MGLVIHDLTPEAWETVRRDYPGWTVVSDTGTIRPCTGCFGCWNRTPGECVIRDGYENMGELIHRADRVTVISRYTFGGFSGFVKNVFDRCLGYVLPQFEVVKIPNMMHGESVMMHPEAFAEKALAFFG